MFATAQNVSAAGVSFAEVFRTGGDMRSQLAAFPLAYDQEQPNQRVCRIFQDRRDFWHMWLIDADDSQAIRCVEWVLNVSACPHAMEKAARYGLELQILTDALVAAVSSICHLRTDHTFSDWECAARFLNDAAQNS
jgi:hypothetical protein